ncbi:MULTISPECIES: hypothetical protein [Citrobacter]|uniref:hypothetical protein n=1 Tax=Citrobacter TaxID=544 RepID=UPI0013DE7285|nr:MULTISPECIES: hypothetical protein [Citrobacter]MBD0827801.1 hypothetical protein [Citrobacter sp. C1]
MNNKLLMSFVVISSLILCSCERKDKECLLPPGNTTDGNKYDKCVLRSNNTPSPKRDW